MNHKEYTNFTKKEYHIYLGAINEHKQYDSCHKTSCFKDISNNLIVALENSKIYLYRYIYIQ